LVSIGHAQTFPPSVSPGDESAQYELLRRYAAAIALDSSNYEAIWQAAAVAVELAEFHPDRRQRDTLFARAERYARNAVAINPLDAEGHFQLARALGRKALTLGVRDRAKYGVEIREQALAALAGNPKHAGALHVLGVWNQQVMQLSSFQRLVAKVLLGAKVFGKASWPEALRNLEDAVAVEPNRIAHRLDLGRLYVIRKREREARDQFLWILAAPARDYNDENYRRQAGAVLESLK
jgi:hypothetical protein